MNCRAGPLFKFAVPFFLLLTQHAETEESQTHKKLMCEKREKAQTFAVSWFRVMKLGSHQTRGREKKRPHSFFLGPTFNTFFNEPI